jgi:4-diphosphocytidyl-2C-methyl-D-erythritol kinase
LGKSIGSDVNFFLSQSSFALMEGRGEKVKPFKGFGLSHVIIWPKVNLATKMVYAAQRAKLTKFLNNVKILQYALKKGDIELVRNNIFNALEKPALSLCRQLSQAQEELSRESIFAKVTGSGSALYTVASGLKADRLKKILPGDWFIREARTF